nr:hypothetical protein GCM10020093_032210 [Planobispora longispora]
MLTTRALTALDAPSVWTLRNPYEEVELHLVRRFEAALDRLPPDDGAERVRLLAGLAQELYDGSDDPRCDRLSAEAVEAARRLGDPHLLMQTLNARQLSLPQSVRSPELLGIAAELLDLAARTCTPEFELLAQMLFTHHRLQLFDVAGADEAATRCDAILERLPLPGRASSTRCGAPAGWSWRGASTTPTSCTARPSGRPGGSACGTRARWWPPGASCCTSSAVPWPTPEP